MLALQIPVTSACEAQAVAIFNHMLQLLGREYIEETMLENTTSFEQFFTILLDHSNTFSYNPCKFIADEIEVRYFEKNQIWPKISIRNADDDLEFVINFSFTTNGCLEIYLQNENHKGIFTIDMYFCNQTVIRYYSEQPDGKYIARLHNLWVLLANVPEIMEEIRKSHQTRNPSATKIIALFRKLEKNSGFKETTHEHSHNC